MQLRVPAPHEAAALAGLTWPAYHFLLQAGTDPRLRCRALAAWEGARPVGLLLSAASGMAQDRLPVQTLLSLRVDPARRRQGVARALLRAWQQALPAELAGVETTYSDRLPGAAALSALLTAEGWSAPRALRYRICAEVRHAASLFADRAAFVRQLQRGGFTILPWTAAAAQANALAARLIAAGAAPGWASPAPYADQLDPALSMVLANGEGSVVGWVVCCYQPALARLFFPIGWIVPPYDRRGWLLGAYAEGARRAEALYGGQMPAVIETGHELPAKWRLLERHVAPLSRWTDRMLFAERRLG